MIALHHQILCVLSALAVAMQSVAGQAIAQSESRDGPSKEPTLCVDAMQQAEARVAAAIERLSRVPTCEAESLRRELEAIRAERAQLEAKLTDLMAEKLEELRAAVLELAPAEDSCARLIVEADGPAGLLVSGRTSDPATLTARIDAVVAHSKGMTVSYSLSALDICGIALGNGYILEEGTAGQPKLVRRSEVGDDRGNRVPTETECAEVGEAVGSLRTERQADWVEAFWVLREGQDPSVPNYVLCRRGQNTGVWLVQRDGLIGEGLSVIRSAEGK